MESARRFFQAGGPREASFRRRQLRALSDAIARHEARLLEALRLDLGKSTVEAYASEIGFVLGDIRYALRHLERWMRLRRRAVPLVFRPAAAWVQPEPYGVALIIGPWNFPFQLLFSPLVSALAAGNCAVLKPSESAPHTAGAVERLVEETFPGEYVRVINGGPDIAQALLEAKPDIVFFTGSLRVGRRVARAAAEGPAPVILELGGKCPCVVCEDAEVETAARRIAWGKFLNAGQTCVAPDFVWAHAAVLPALEEALKRAIVRFYGPDPKRSADFGRIVHAGHFKRLRECLSQGRVAHGGATDENARYVAPTILRDVPTNALAMQEEIFGPILPLRSFERLSDVLAELRSRPAPLAVYLFTKDRGIERRFLEETRSGALVVNDTVNHVTARSLPFGGVGASGMGAYHGEAGFEAFSHRRVVWRRHARWGVRLAEPPVRAPWQAVRWALRLFLG